MARCCRVRVVWECPICQRQTVTLEGESGGRRPYICDFGHTRVEMEQRLPEAFVASRQHIGEEEEEVSP